MMYVKLALRNVFRNKRRTAITLIAIAFGCIALIINGGIIYNIFWALRQDAIHGRHGHIQIYQKGYVKGHMAKPYDYVISRDAYEQLKLHLASLDHVEHYMRKVEFWGLTRISKKGIPFMGIGVEPDRDSTFSTQVTIIKGQGLSRTDPDGVLLGKGLAEKMVAKPGDSLVLLGTDRNNYLHSVDAKVRGIFEGGMKVFDDWTMKMPLQKAQELLRLDGIHCVVLLLDDDSETESLTGRLMNLFTESGLPLELRTWPDLALFHNQVVDLFGRELDIIKLIISVIVILSILNTMGMTVVERTKEIGTIMAVGTKRRRVLLMFLLEALIIGFIGGLLGIMGGIILAKIISAFGITFPSPPGATRPYIGKVDIVFSVLILSFAISVGSTMIAALLPAYRASRLRIAEALRHV